MKQLHAIFHVTTYPSAKLYLRMRTKNPDPDLRSTTPLVTLRFSIDHDSNLAIQSIFYSIFLSPYLILYGPRNAVTTTTCRNQCNHNELTVNLFCIVIYVPLSSRLQVFFVFFIICDQITIHDSLHSSNSLIQKRKNKIVI